jgi:hypothetical protein
MAVEVQLWELQTRQQLVQDQAKLQAGPQMVEGKDRTNARTDPARRTKIVEPTSKKGSLPDSALVTGKGKVFVGPAQGVRKIG